MKAKIIKIAQKEVKSETVELMDHYNIFLDFRIAEFFIIYFLSCWNIRFWNRCSVG